MASPSSNAMTEEETASTDHNVLIGTGDRIVKLGFVEIYVYKLKLFVDRTACRSSLNKYLGQDLNGLLRDSSSFYSAFVAGNFTKTFQLTFCRSLTQEKLVGGFDEPLKSRCDDAHQEDAQRLLANLVPTTGVQQGDVLTLVCHGDGESLTGLYLPSSAGADNGTTSSANKEQELIALTSSGQGGAWLALQNIYFDDQTQLPTIRMSAISDLPNILLVEDPSLSLQQQSKEATAANCAQPSQAEIDALVQEEFVHPGSSTNKTWRDFAGRAQGPTGYKFGDFTLGVVKALGIRKPAAAAAAAAAAKNAGVPTTTTNTTRDLATTGTETTGIQNIAEKDDTIQQLQKRIEELEAQNRCLEQELKDTNQQSRTFARIMSAVLVASLASIEGVYAFLEAVTNMTAPSSFQKFQLYSSTTVGLFGYYYVVEKRKWDEQGAARARATISNNEAAA